MVNRGLEQTTAEVQLDGFAAAGTATLWEVTADDYEAINNVEHPDAVASTSRQLPVANGQAMCELQASSVYVLEVTR
jgi:alpha-N-arabinofuranosidase